MQKITSLKELDAELLQSKPFVDVNGVDLRKLCKFVVPEKDLVEVSFNQRYQINRLDILLIIGFSLLAR